MGSYNHLAACSAAFKINSTQVRFGRPKHVAHVNEWGAVKAKQSKAKRWPTITVSIFASETNCTLIAYVQLKASSKRNETKWNKTKSNQIH